MSLIKALTAFSAILLLILGTIGCDDHKHHDSANMMYSEGSPYYAPVQIPEIIYMSPSDGTMNHNISTQIIMAFNMPMDTMSVMHNFHMAGGDDMHHFMDSLEHCSSDSGMMGGGMGGMMDMEHMMDWMDSIQCPGHFEWNDDMDTCIFNPFSPLMPGTDYMIFMNGEMQAHNGTMMNMGNMDYDAHIVHFATGNYGSQTHQSTD